MLYTPTSNFRSKKGYFGVATSQGPSGHWMRTLGARVQPNSDRSVAWRHIFMTAKLIWNAISQPDSPTDPITELTAAQAWAIVAGYYFGILQAGFQVDGVQEEGVLIGCQSEEAYFTMCQTNLASLGITAPVSPPLTEIAAAPAGTTVTDTIAPTTLSVTPQPGEEISPLGAVFTASMAVAVSAYATPTSNTSNGPYWYDFIPNQLAITQGGTADCSSEIQLPPESSPTIYNTTFTASGLPSGVTASFNGMGNPATLTPTQQVITGLTLTASAIAAPGSYEITVTCVSNGVTNYCYFTLVVYSTAENTYTLQATGLPAGATVSPNPTTITPSYNPAGPALTGGVTFTVNVPYTQALGTYPFTATLTGPNTPVAVTPSITVTTSGLVPVTPPAIFAFPSALSSATVYDSGYNVTGFQLDYEWVQSWVYPAASWVWNGTGWEETDAPAAPGIWEIAASAQYDLGYAAPAVSTWSPILFSGPNMPSAADVLAAWVANYGPLPSSGNIKFQACYLDPATGASGPALSCTATWEAGTLRGADLSTWTGPIWGWGIQLVWNNTTTYQPGTAVEDSGVFWLALAASTGVTPTEGAYWTNLTSPVYDAAFTYAYQQVVTYSGQSWYALQQSTGQTPSNSQYWQASPFGAWNSGTAYFTNGLVTYGGLTWTALQDSTGVTPAAGAYWSNTQDISPLGPVAPGTFSFAATVAAYNGYSGTITFSGKGSGYIPTGTPPGLIELPPGTSISFDPPTLTFAADTPPNAQVLVTITAAAGAQAFSGPLKISGTDGISTRSSSFTTSVQGDVVEAPPFNLLTIGVFNTNPYTPSPSTTTVAVALGNASAEDIAAVMLATCANPAITFAWDDVNPTVPAGTYSSPGTATVNLTITIPASIDTAGIQVLISAQAGAYTASCGLFLGGTGLANVTASASPALLTIPSPGTGSTTVTFNNYGNAAVTLAMSSIVTGTPVTTAFSPSTVTVPAASGSVPGTASTTATVTMPSGVSLPSAGVLMVGTEGGATASANVEVI